MTTITSPQFIEVEFKNLNTIASQLRIAGAAFNVSKTGELFRIFFKKSPQIATVEQILNSTTPTPEVETNTVQATTEQPEVIALEIKPTPKVETDTVQSDAIVFSEQAVTTEQPEAIALEVMPTSTEETLTLKLATLDQLLALKITKLRKLGKTHHITGYTKMLPEKLASKLHGKVTIEAV